MAAPSQPVTLSPEEIEHLRLSLSNLRHNVNNYASLIVAAAELIRRRPEDALRFAESLSEQPERISREIRAFSDQLERLLQISPG